MEASEGICNPFISSESEEILFKKEEVQEKVKELAEKIALDYKNKPLVLIVVLKGASIFASDLIRLLWHEGLTDVEIDFVQISSYGSEV